jgi:rhodanese-related sulfurtransferase
MIKTRILGQMRHQGLIIVRLPDRRGQPGNMKVPLPPTLRALVALGGCVYWPAFSIAWNTADGCSPDSIRDRSLHPGGDLRGSAGGQSLSNGQLTALVNADKALVIDIRTSKEYSAGHIVGALNIPQDKVANRMAELEKHKEKTLIVVDAMGQQSGAVCGELIKAGYTAAKLSGGVSSWKADNLPLVK